jgi:hypothetical protein
MAEKRLNTRISLKYGSIGSWTSSFKPNKGEVCFAEIIAKQTDAAGNIVNIPTVVFKVGDGTKTFGELPWASALAADVYGWAKQENLPVVRNDGKNEDGTDKVAGNVISGITWDAEAKSIKYTTASVATSEGMATLQAAVDAIEKDIADNRDAWLEKTVDTNTTYKFTIPTEGDDKGKLLIESKEIDGSFAKLVALDFVTPDELTTALAGYYTKGDIDNLVKDKLHTQEDIEGYIDAALSAVSNTDTIEGITTLVEYVNEHGTDLAAITKEIYGDAGKVGDDPSRIDNAVADSAQAKSDASQAKTDAENALSKANEALEGAEGAAASAAAAKASEEAAAGSAEAAAGSASAANTSAGAAATSAQEANTAKEAAVAAQGLAEAAKSGAETAKAGADQAKDAAVIAKGEAETAQAAAIEAKNAAVEAKNAAAGSATDANNAKVAAEEAKTGANLSAQAANASAESASTAAGMAQTAQQAAENAQAGATTSANNAATSAENAGKAQTAAETAQSKAEAAQKAAEDAQAAAEASNTSATAIANEAKSTADAAKTASETATQNVNTLTGEVNALKALDFILNNDTVILDCGGAE